MNVRAGSLDAVLASIRDQFAERGEWRLSTDTVRALLGLDHATFYPKVYAAAQRSGGMVELSTVTQTFTTENVGELVELLEIFVDRRAEPALTRIGAFLPQELRVELTARLLETARDRAKDHRVDPDEFREMLRARRGYEAARDLYLSHHFSRAGLIAESVERFLRDHSFDVRELAAHAAGRVLERLFRSHIVEIPTLLVGVGVRLFEMALASGYAKRPEDEAAEEASQRGPGDQASSPELRTQACRVLELEPQEANEDAIKRQYKRLMLRFHPDLNPRGLRKAQQLNEAYALLLETE
ncbi:MAG: DnaJ domain-containing protein [Spirochaetes bacterium]|jgi:hypothetical protein|nr:DnaJ domain-containing protein [Spirochaetota bacterium]